MLNDVNSRGERRGAVRIRNWLVSAYCQLNMAASCQLHVHVAMVSTRSLSPSLPSTLVKILTLI